MSTENETGALASEAGHWYWPDGRPCYQVPRKGKPGPGQGPMRDTTLGDARKLGLGPSVTTIGKEAAAPQLVVWMKRQAILSACTLPRKPGETEDDFADRALEDSEEQGRRAREAGTSIHAAVELAIADKEYDPQWKPHAQAALRELPLGKWWASEKSFFSSEHGFGGKVDLYCLPGLIQKDAWIVDIKGKEFYPTSKNLAYDEHGVQLAGYRLGLGLSGAKLANLFVSRSVPGLARLHVWEPEESARHESMFLALLAYWEAKTGYSAKGLKP